MLYLKVSSGLNVVAGFSRAYFGPRRSSDPLQYTSKSISKTRGLDA